MFYKRGRQTFQALDDNVSVNTNVNCGVINKWDYLS